MYNVHVMYCFCFRKVALTLKMVSLNPVRILKHEADEEKAEVG